MKNTTAFAQCGKNDKIQVQRQICKYICKFNFFLSIITCHLSKQVDLYFWLACVFHGNFSAIVPKVYFHICIFVNSTSLTIVTPVAVTAEDRSNF